MAFNTVVSDNHLIFSGDKTLKAYLQAVQTFMFLITVRCQQNLELKSIFSSVYSGVGFFLGNVFLALSGKSRLSLQSFTYIYLYTQPQNTWIIQFSTGFLKKLVWPCLHPLLSLQVTTGHLLPSLVHMNLWPLLASILKGLCVQKVSEWEVFCGFCLLSALTQSRELYWLTGHGARSRQWDIKP